MKRTRIGKARPKAKRKLVTSAKKRRRARSVPAIKAADMKMAQEPRTDTQSAKAVDPAHAHGHKPMKMFEQFRLRSQDKFRDRAANANKKFAIGDRLKLAKIAPRRLPPSGR